MDPAEIPNEVERAILRGQRLRQIRSRSRLSIRKVAEMSGLNKNTILKIEAGEPVREASWIKVCNAFGLIASDSAIRVNRYAGRAFQRHRREDDSWLRMSVVDPAEPSLVSRQESIQDQETRKWLGLRGRGNQFMKRLLCDRPDGQLRAAIFEVYGPSGWSRQTSGEAFIYVLSGIIEFLFEDERFVVGEGEAATFDRTQLHMHQIPEGITAPATFLYVQID